MSAGYIPMAADDVFAAIRETCPECGAPPGEICRGISAVVINAHIISKRDGSDVGIWVVHDERAPSRQGLKLVR